MCNPEENQNLFTMKSDRNFPYDPQQDVHQITLYNTVARSHRHRSAKKRLTLHIDMNCFYAQVEQQAWNLYGLPLAMGGWRKPDGTPRGIVATASYEARKLGVETAMSAWEAHRICPYLLFMQIDYDKYKGISRRLKSILDRFSPEVEKYSMDEYFMDVSFLLGRPQPVLTAWAEKLKRTIFRELGLVCSVGIATSKTWAKLASGCRKPDGLLMVLNPDDAARHLFRLPLKKVWGIGQRRFEKLRHRGIETIADAFARGPAPFRELFGAMQGELFHEIITGRDRARILDHENHVPDEVSYMHTFSDWSVEHDRIRSEIVRAVRKVCYRLRAYRRKAQRWGCYIRYQNTRWDGVTFAFSTPGYTSLDDYVLQACLPEADRIVKRAIARGEKIRGVGLHTIDMRHKDQLELFFREDEPLRALYSAADRLNNCYGADTVTQASLRHLVPGKTHFVNRS